MTHVNGCSSGSEMDLDGSISRRPGGLDASSKGCCSNSDDWCDCIWHSEMPDRQFIDVFHRSDYGRDGQDAVRIQVPDGTHQLGRAVAEAKSSAPVAEAPERKFSVQAGGAA